MNGPASAVKIEELVARVQAIADPAARSVALDLVQAVMDLHAEGLKRMLDIVFETDQTSRVMDAVGADDRVGALLLLHDLHPLDLEARVKRALEQLAFQSRGASAELLSADHGVVRVRLDGGPGLRAAVEKALAGAAPDAEAILLEDSAGQRLAAPDFVPLEQLLAT